VTIDVQRASASVAFAGRLFSTGMINCLSPEDNVTSANIAGAIIRDTPFLAFKFAAAHPYTISRPERTPPRVR
jgi:hypothetical protein